MTNEIVKYNNRLNSIPLGRLSSNELNLFITLVQRAYQKGTEKQVYSFEELKKLSKYDRSTSNFVKDIWKTNSKLLAINAYTDDGITITQFACFNFFQTDREKQTLTVAINPLFQGLFNDLKQWTRFQLQQFNELHSTYAKNLFRLIKQFRTVGRLRLTKDEFFEQLNLPKSYLNRPNNVKAKVLKPIKEELSSLVRGLTVQAVKGSGRGRPVVGYEFTWHPEANNADDFSKGDYADQRQKLDNIDLNPSLTPEEKAHAYDRVLGFKLGTTDHKQWQKINAEGLSAAEIKRQLAEKEREDEFRELLKNWLQFYGRANAQIVNKLRFLYDSYGLDKVCTKIAYYGQISNLGLEPLRILELIENSLTQEQGEN